MRSKLEKISLRSWADRRELDHGARHVGEHDGGLDEAVDNRPLPRLEALGDGLGQDVEQQALGLGALVLDLRNERLLLVPEALLLE